MRHLKGRWGDGDMCGFKRAEKGGKGRGERAVSYKCTVHNRKTCGLFSEKRGIGIGDILGGRDG